MSRAPFAPPADTAGPRAPGRAVGAALALAAAAGCSGPVPDPLPLDAQPAARFADATEDQKRQVLQLIRGQVWNHAWEAIQKAELDVEQGCPRGTEEEDGTLVIKGRNCTANSGRRYAGRAWLDARARERSPDGAAWGFEGFEVTLEDLDPQVFHGTWSQEVLLDDNSQDVDLSARIADGYATGLVEPALPGAYAGRWHLDCSYELTANKCTFAQGASGAVEGLGGFAISGTFDDIDLHSATEGLVKLAGEDGAEIDFTDAADRDGCVLFRTDAGESTVCP